MRSLFLIIAVVGAWWMLRGWPEGWHLLVRASLGVSLLVVAVALWGKREEGRGLVMVPDRGIRWLDHATLGAGVLLVEVLFLLFFTTAPGWIEAASTGFQDRIHPGRLEKTGEAGRENFDAPGGVGSGGPKTGNWLWDGAGKRSLSGSGETRTSNRPEVFLYPESVEDGRALLARRPYVRSFTLTTFEDGAWSPGDFSAETLRAEEGRVVFPGEGNGRKSFTYDLFHGEGAVGQNVLAAMPGVREVFLPYLREQGPATYGLPPLEAGASGYRYRVRSEPLDFEELVTSAEGVELLRGPPPAFDPRYLQLPQDAVTRDFLLGVAARTEGNTLVTMHQIKEYLQKNYRYSLSMENPEGKPALENFLMGVKAGHCEHFATASTLLCRAAGIPARIAYGWSGGYYFPTQNFCVFRGAEAHAWTEVLLEGQGWVIFDSTPPEISTARTQIAPAGEEPPVPGATEEGVVEEGTGEKFLGWGAAALVGIFGGLLMARRGGKEGVAGLRRGVSGVREAGYLRRFREASAKLGEPMPPGRTLRGQLASLAAAGLEPGWGGEFLRYHYGTVYGGRGKDEGVERDFVVKIREWGDGR